MYGEFDDLHAMKANDSKLINELAVANLLKIMTHEKFNDVVSREEEEEIKEFLKFYVKESITSMQKELEEKKGRVR